MGRDGHKAVDAGGNLYPTTEDFNRACEHVLQLLADATTLFHARSFGTATFLAITAIEETAKLSVGIFRKGESDGRRRGDPLYSHADKHAIAAVPFPLSLRPRLIDALGEEAANSLLDQAHCGDFVKRRESSLYADTNQGRLTIPKDVVASDDARGTILFALDIYTDVIVGLTNRTYSLGEQADKLFERVASATSNANRPG